MDSVHPCGSCARDLGIIKFFYRIEVPDSQDAPPGAQGKLGPVSQGIPFPPLL